MQPSISSVSSQAKAVKRGTKRTGSPSSTQATSNTGNNKKRLCIGTPNVAVTTASAESLEIGPNQTEPVANSVSPNEEEEAETGQVLEPTNILLKEFLKENEIILLHWSITTTLIGTVFMRDITPGSLGAIS